MDIDRNRYFMFGVILFLLGLQFRLVDSFVLNENSTRALQVPVVRDILPALLRWGSVSYTHLTLPTNREV